MSSNRALLCLVVLVACSAFGPVALALQPPVGVARDNEILLSTAYQNAADFVLVDGEPHVFHGSRSGHFEYAWFDGLSWRAQIIANEQVHAVKVLSLGGVLHVAATLSVGDAPPQLHYFTFNLRSGLPLRRSLLPGGTPRSFHLAANEGGALPVVIAQLANGSVLRYDTLQAGPVSASPVTQLIGLTDLALLDLRRSPSGPLWLAYAFRDGSFPARYRLAVLGLTSIGTSINEVIDEHSMSPQNARYQARLAISNDGSPLIAFVHDTTQTLSFTFATTRHYWRRRTAPGQWICADDCGLTTADSAIDPRVLAAHDDVGGGYVSVLTRRGGTLWQRRIDFDGQVEDLPRADRVSVWVHALRSRPPFFDTFLFDRTESSTNVGDVGNLILSLPNQTAWRSYLRSGLRVDAGLSAAIDPAGEPVLVAQGSAAEGLRRSHWNAAEQRFELAAIRPPGETYGRTATAFANDGSMHVIALNSASGALLHLELAVGMAMATPTQLSMDAHPSSSPQIAVDIDGALLASWWEPSSNTIKLARRAVGESWTISTLPGQHSDVATPQLALSRTGVVFVSAYDSAARRIRVWQRVSADINAPFELRLQTDANAEQPAHALAATRDARPVLAYVRAEFAGDPERLAYRYPRECCGNPNLDVVDLGLPFELLPGQDAEQIRLSLVDGSPSDARILLRYRSAGIPGERVVYATRTVRDRDDPFEVTDLGNLTGTGTTAGIDLLATPTSTFVAATEGQNLQVLRHADLGMLDSANLRRERLAPIRSEARPAPPTTRVPLDEAWIGLCFCVLTLCNQPTFPRTDAVAGADLPLDLSQRLRERFATTAAGRRQLELFTQHGREMATLTLDDAFFFAERIGTFALFTPGLEAWVDGRGHEVRMNADMLRRAEQIWRYYADRGSPELRATIALELERTDNLQRFANLTFDQWFAALPSGFETFKNGFEGPP